MDTVQLAFVEDPCGGSRGREKERKKSTGKIKKSEKKYGEKVRKKKYEK
jgi:hypothetical protein